MSLTFTVPERDVIAWRRHLHMYPELSFREHQTAHFVEGKLHDFGIETTRPTETSVVGTVEGNREADPDATVRCVALRADIDALPVQESSGLSFASTVPGVMHACGHDAHTAMLLGTAKVLADNRDQFSGTVKLIFQHAEELNPGGAQAMVDAGVLEGVDQIYGLHVMNGPVGTVQIAHGNTTSSAGGGFITIQGVGSHGSMPHKGTDPLICAAELAVALNHIVSRDIDPWTFCVVNVGALNSGTAPNVIPDTARLGFSIRTFDTEVADLAYRRVEEMAAGICQAYGCTYEFEWVPPYAVVENDPARLRRRPQGGGGGERLRDRALDRQRGLLGLQRRGARLLHHAQRRGREGRPAPPEPPPRLRHQRGGPGRRGPHRGADRPGRPRRPGGGPARGRRGVGGAMPKASRETASVLQEIPGAVSRSENFPDGWTVNFETVTEDVDTAAQTARLPGGLCPTAHLGYVLTGSITYRGRHGEETFTAGEAYSVEPGHTAFVTAGTEYVEFSPTEEQVATYRHAVDTWQGLLDSGQLPHIVVAP